jgi:uncharacterized protein Smg (DUF494 family)
MAQQTTHTYLRFLDVVMQLATELQSCKSFKDVHTERFGALGYGEQEISTGMSWLMDKMSMEVGRSVLPFPAPHSVRVFDQVEKELLSPEAQGLLTQLHQLSLLSQAELEEVLDRVMVSEYGTAEVEEVRHVVAAVLFGSDDGRSNGSRLMLRAGDTIH